jgi:drug/metabolite transporter (DMT)-like permease
MNYILILISVSLSAFSQVILRHGMTRPAISEALNAGSISVATEILRSPFVIAGLGAYGAGAVIWLFVLSRIPVSFAYPFVSLGIVLTTVIGATVLSERVSLVSGFGVLIIVAGIGMVAYGRS